MKKFKFRLQRVLEYRHTLTKDKERELAMRNGELHEAEGGLEMILDAQDRDGGVAAGVMSMAELALRGEYYEALQSSLIRQREVVEQAVKAVDAAREAYRVKAIEEETLETLKEKKVNEHHELARKDERKQLDSLVVQRHRFTKADNK